MSLIHRTNKKKTEFAGYSFASKLEANTFGILRLRESAKEIRDIQVQDTIYLSEAKITYKPDFKYFDIASNDYEWAEAKGIETPEWRIKRRLWMAYGPGKLHIYMAKKFSTIPFLKETLIPNFGEP